MANTTNFGWETPDDTDYVKDGALAMRTLGNAIDTSLADLKGGTTGQVLAKATNTDMDFTWSTPSPAPDFIAGKNAIINGGFDFWQRGTSISSAASVVYGPDRFAFYRGDLSTGATLTRQTTTLSGFRYAARLQRNSGNTGTAQVTANQVFETVSTIPLAGQTVTVSFYARRGANFSATSNLMNVNLGTGTGTDQEVNTYRFGGWTGQSAAIDTTQALTTTWTRYSFTGTIGASVTQICLALSFTPVGTAGADDWFEITGVQLEAGSVATPFSRAAGTLQGELAACQRYYWRTPAQSNLWQPGTGSASSATNIYTSLPHPVTMRIPAASVDFASLLVFDGVATSNVSAVTIQGSTNYSTTVSITASSLTQYRFYHLLSQSSGNGYIGLSAEL